MSKTEKVFQLLSDSRLALINQQNEEALSLAKEAQKLDPNNPETYKCAANACMSMEQFDQAINNYKIAVKWDPNNGNRYYDLGFALASDNKLADAMKNFTKAEELGCAPENLAQLYRILGLICFDIGRYEDSIINLSKAEQLLGVDMDILQRKAVLYGLKGEVSNGLQIANQIKLIAPSEYIGYQVAFKLLLQGKRLADAQKELQKAEKYAVLPMDYYFDCMTLELEQYKADNNTEHYEKALISIETALKTLKPEVQDVVEAYLNAAEIHIQLEDAEQTLNCLNAAQNPAYSYNHGFDVIVKETQSIELTEYDLEEMAAADREKIAEQYSTDDLEELFERTEPDEDGNRDYFTELEDETEQTDTVYRLDESEKLTYPPEDTDHINRLYVGAYTLQKEFQKVIEYAKKLQTSEDLQNSYIGRYAEVNAMGELKSEDAPKKYEEVIRFFRNAMIKDPTDILAVTFPIQ